MMNSNQVPEKLPFPDSLASFSRMLRDALHGLLCPEPSTFLGMLAADAVMEFPYAPGGMPSRLEGRAAIEEHVEKLKHILSIESVTTPTVYRAQQSGVVVLEFGCLGRALQTGRPYNQTYISVITLRDGLIAHYKDYWNPLVVLEALSGTSADSQQAEES